LLQENKEKLIVLADKLDSYNLNEERAALDEVLSNKFAAVEDWAQDVVDGAKVFNKREQYQKPRPATWSSPPEPAYYETSGIFLFKLPENISLEEIEKFKKLVLEEKPLLLDKLNAPEELKEQIEKVDADIEWNPQETEGEIFANIILVWFE